MIGGLIALASYGIVGGGTAGNFLYQLETLGVFSYVLPFLMIFAIIYAILDKAHILGDNAVINFILSLAVALMALQFNFVSYFFADIFPRLGVVLSILLTFIILLGLFPIWDNNNGVKWVFGILAGLAGIVIVFESFSDAFGWGGWDPFNNSLWWSLQGSIGYIVVGILILGVFIAIPLSMSAHKKKKKQNKGP